MLKLPAESRSLRLNLANRCGLSKLAQSTSIKLKKSVMSFSAAVRDERTKMKYQYSIQPGWQFKICRLRQPWR